MVCTLDGHMGMPSPSIFYFDDRAARGESLQAFTGAVSVGMEGYTTESAVGRAFR